MKTTLFKPLYKKNLFRACCKEVLGLPFSSRVKPLKRAYYVNYPTNKPLGWRGAKPPLLARRVKFPRKKVNPLKVMAGFRSPLQRPSRFVEKGAGLLIRRVKPFENRVKPLKGAYWFNGLTASYQGFGCKLTYGLTPSKRKRISLVNSSNSAPWEGVFKNLETKFKGLPQAIFKQNNKKRVKDGSLTLEEGLKRLTEADPTQTIGLDVSKLDPPLICLDVDTSVVGERLLKGYADDELKEVFTQTMGNPLIVETTTPNHCHLYYKAPLNMNLTLPVDSEGRVKPFKRLATTRVGFECEYCYNQITFAARNRQIKGNTTLVDLPVLPYSLYPYNYVPSQFVKPLVSLNGSLIKQGTRNDTFFKFFVKDNFKLNHLQVANQLCCETPMDNDELKTLTNRANKENLEEPLLSDQFNLFSFEPLDQNFSKEKPIRLRPGESKPEITYKSLISSGELKTVVANSLAELGFNPSRAKAALKGRRTLEQTLCYLALIENETDTFLDDDLWIGESLLGVATLVLLNLKEIHVIYISSEEAYYTFNGKYWVVTSEEEVASSVTRISQRVCKFQNISNLTDKKAILNVIAERSSYPVWPHRAAGFNFLNGSLLAENDQIVRFVQHQPEHYFRRLIKINYEPYRSLSIWEGRFILDFTNGSHYLINIIRLVLYCCFESGGNQIAAFIMGAPGGSKSTLFSIIEKLVVGARSVTNINSLTQRFGLMSQVKGSSVMLVDDLSENAITDKTAAVLKKIIAGNSLNDEIKYQGFEEFIPGVFLLLASNYDPADFDCFKDPAFSDRILLTPAASIKANHRVNDYVERLFQLSNNCAGLVNWVIQQKADCINQVNRASDLNSVIYPSKTLVDDFVLEKLVYQENFHLSYRDLHKAYRTYAAEVNKTEGGRAFKEYGDLSLRKLGSALRDFSKKLDSETYFYDKPKRDAKGLQNVNIKQDDLTASQKKIKLLTDPVATKLLMQDPFYYAGPLIRNPNKLYNQYAPPPFTVELGTKLAVKATDKYSSKMLIEGTISKDFIPNSHILSSTTSTGPRINEATFWQDIPNIVLSGGASASPKSLTKGLEKGIEQYLETVNLPENQLKDPYFFNKEPSIPQPSDFDQSNKQEVNLNEQNPRPEPAPTSTETTTKDSNDGESPPKAAKKGRPKIDDIVLTKDEQKILNKNYINDWDTFKELLAVAVSESSPVKDNKESLIDQMNTRFNESHKGIQTCYREVRYNLFNIPLKPYQTFKAPYPSVSQIIDARQYFKNFPLMGPIPLIKFINHHFLNPMNRAFNIIRSHRKSDEHSYFGRSLPGVNNQPSQVNLLERVFEKTEYRIQRRFNDKHSSFENWKGTSLFPVTYQEGEAAYGRLKSIPTSTLSTMKQELKSSVLKVVTDLTKIKFVELDLKSCHTVIFKALANLTQEEQNQFPSLAEHWTTLTLNFKDILNKTFNLNESRAVQIVKEWDDNQIKNLIKVQWYKALNAGNMFNPRDNLKNQANDLGLQSENTLSIVKPVVEEIFKQIPLFNILGTFQKKVNACEVVYLPTESEAFSTQTPSKKQKAGQKQTTTSKTSVKGMTGMSRIFSSCELVLIFFVFLALAEIKNVIPISYEADGLLIAGYFENKDDLLKQINKVFREYAKSFMQEDFALEFKNLSTTDR